MEGDVILTQDLFAFDHEGGDKDGNITGTFHAEPVRPALIELARRCGLDGVLLEAMGGGPAREAA